MVKEIHLYVKVGDQSQMHLPNLIHQILNYKEDVFLIADLIFIWVAALSQEELIEQISRARSYMVFSFPGL